MQVFRRAALPAALVAALSLLVVSGAQGIGPASPAGSGGSPPDLVITKTATLKTALVGDLLVYYIRVSLKPDAKITATATEVRVVDQLPSGVTLLSTYSDRGSGCGGTTTLVCFLDYINGAAVGTITVRTKVTALGTLVNTASVSASQQDPDKSNNSATATVTVVPPPAPPAPNPAAGPPRLLRKGPAELRASRSGVVSFLLFVSEPVTVGVQVSDRTGAPVELVQGSRLAKTGTQQPVLSLTAAIEGPKVIRVNLRFDTDELVRGKRYRALVQATDRDGKPAGLSVFFRG